MSPTSAMSDAEASAGTSQIAYQQALGACQAGRLPQAAALCRRILQDSPAFAAAMHLLGAIEHKRGNQRQALSLIGRALHAEPLNHLYWRDIGPVYAALSRFEDALLAYRRALLLAPDAASIYNNLGNLHHRLGDFPAAADSLGKALTLAPDQPMFEYNLGGVYCDAGRLDESELHLRKALQLQPEYADAHHRLGKVQRLRGRLGAAADCCRRTIALNPGSSRAFGNLAGICKLHGDADAAVQLYRRALAIEPGYSEAFSNMLFAMQYADTLSPAELFAEHLRYAERYEASVKPIWRPHDNNRDAQRRLRIGYVSADFNHHAVAYFMEPVLAHHDAAQIETFCYYNNTRRDLICARMAAAADHWIPCQALSDEQLAARIRQDGIDILVDLSGHTAGNRLPVFARKPAPVQVTWLGYFGSSGLSAMDYRFTDDQMDPPGVSEAMHTEKLLRLPHIAPFQPAAASPPVNALPALTQGRLTLASLNNLAKISRRAIRLWARILEALPESVLVLCNLGDDLTKRLLLGRFAEAGIGAERLQLKDWLPIQDYLELHHEIDLALDSFPYNGGTITNHSLWMGVPVVTLAGDRPVARIGAALMTRAGLPQFIARNEEEYFACVVRAASDLPELNRIRLGLRERLDCNDGASPERLTRAVEEAYRRIWREWCGETRIIPAAD